MTKTFKLSKPISVIKNDQPIEIKELALREPTGDELMEMGMPFRVIRETNSDKFEIVMDTKVFKKMLGAISGMPGEIGQLAGSDINNIFSWLTEVLAPTGNSE